MDFCIQIYSLLRFDQCKGPLFLGKLYSKLSPISSCPSWQDIVVKKDPKQKGKSQKSQNSRICATTLRPKMRCHHDTSNQNVTMLRCFDSKCDIAAKLRYSAATLQKKKDQDCEHSNLRGPASQFFVDDARGGHFSHKIMVVCYLYIKLT